MLQSIVRRGLSLVSLAYPEMVMVGMYVLRVVHAQTLTARPELRGLLGTLLLALS